MHELCINRRQNSLRLMNLFMAWMAAGCDDDYSFISIALVNGTVFL